MVKAQSRLVSVIYKFRLSRKSLSQHEVRSRMSFKGSGWLVPAVGKLFDPLHLQRGEAIPGA